MNRFILIIACCLFLVSGLFQQACAAADSIVIDDQASQQRALQSAAQEKRQNSFAAWPTLAMPASVGSPSYSASFTYFGDAFQLSFWRESVGATARLFVKVTLSSSSLFFCPGGNQFKIVQNGKEYTKAFAVTKGDGSSSYCSTLTKDTIFVVNQWDSVIAANFDESAAFTIGPDSSGTGTLNVGAASATTGATVTPPANSTISNARFFAYAEGNAPSLFSGTPTPGQLLQYSYRYYPLSGNFLAIDSNGAIYVVGPATGNSLLSIGSVSSFASSIASWESTQTSTPAGKPAISLSATSLTISSQTINVPSPARIISVTNTGSGDLYISRIAAVGDGIAGPGTVGYTAGVIGIDTGGGGDFALTHNCGNVMSISVTPTQTITGAKLAAGASCTISIVFTPTGLGNRSGYVRVISNADTSPSFVSLNGTGVCPASQVEEMGVCITPPPVCATGQVVQNGVCVTPSPVGVNGSWVYSYSIRFSSSECTQFNAGSTTAQFDLSEDSAGNVTQTNQTSGSRTGHRTGNKITLSRYYSSSKVTRNEVWTWNGGNTMTGSFSLICYNSTKGVIVEELIIPFEAKRNSK